MDELMTRMSEQEIKYAAGAEKSAVASAFEQNRRGQNYGQSVGSADETTRREGEIAGRIISVSNLKVEIFLKRTDVGIRDLLCAEKDGVRGWLNIGNWTDAEAERSGKTVTFRTAFLEISFTGVGLERRLPRGKG